MKILSFGHIPTWAGGRQTQGAANVIFNLALNISKLDNVDISLAVSDVFVEKKTYGKLKILGWTKTALILYVLKNPLVAFIFFVKLFFLKIVYYQAFGFFNTFMKGIHLRNCIDIIQPEIIHFHGTDEAIYECLVPKNIKIVVTLHGIAGDDVLINHFKSFAKMERDICHSYRISKLYLITHKLNDELLNLYEEIVPPVEVILNAYNCEYFFYIEHEEHEKLSVCTIATMSDRKGQERVLDGLLQSSIECNYTCIGYIDDIISRRMIDNARDSNVNLVLTGPINPTEIRNCMSAVDYMILPSSSEGFGLVFLEAIACGVPVVLPKQLPIMMESIIKPGVNALVLEDCSSLSISNQILTMSQAKFDHRLVSQSVIDFTWLNIAQKYFDSFSKIL